MTFPENLTKIYNAFERLPLSEEKKNTPKAVHVFLHVQKDIVSITPKGFWNRILVRTNLSSEYNFKKSSEKFCILIKEGIDVYESTKKPDELNKIISCLQHYQDFVQHYAEKHYQKAEEAKEKAAFLNENLFKPLEKLEEVLKAKTSNLESAKLFYTHVNSCVAKTKERLKTETKELFESDKISLLTDLLTFIVDANKMADFDEKNLGDQITALESTIPEDHKDELATIKEKLVRLNTFTPPTATTAQNLKVYLQEERESIQALITSLQKKIQQPAIQEATVNLKPSLAAQDVRSQVTVQREPSPDVLKNNKGESGQPAPLDQGDSLFDGIKEAEEDARDKLDPDLKAPPTQPLSSSKSQEVFLTDEKNKDEKHEPSSQDQGYSLGDELEEIIKSETKDKDKKFSVLEDSTIQQQPPSEFQEIILTEKEWEASRNRITEALKARSKVERVESAEEAVPSSDEKAPPSSKVSKLRPLQKSVHDQTAAEIQKQVAFLQQLNTTVTGVSEIIAFASNPSQEPAKLSAFLKDILDILTLRPDSEKQEQVRTWIFQALAVSLKDEKIGIDELQQFSKKAWLYFKENQLRPPETKVNIEAILSEIEKKLPDEIIRNQILQEIMVQDPHNAQNLYKAQDLYIEATKFCSDCKNPTELQFEKPLSFESLRQSFLQRRNYSEKIASVPMQIDRLLRQKEEIQEQAEQVEKGLTQINSILKECDFSETKNMLLQLLKQGNSTIEEWRTRVANLALFTHDLEEISKTFNSGTEAQRQLKKWFISWVISCVKNGNDKKPLEEILLETSQKALKTIEAEEINQETIDLDRDQFTDQIKSFPYKYSEELIKEFKDSIFPYLPDFKSPSPFIPWSELLATWRKKRAEQSKAMGKYQERLQEIKSELQTQQGKIHEIKRQIAKLKKLLSTGDLNEILDPLQADNALIDTSNEDLEKVLTTLVGLEQNLILLQTGTEFEQNAAALALDQIVSSFSDFTADIENAGIKSLVSTLVELSSSEMINRDLMVARFSNDSRNIQQEILSLKELLKRFPALAEYTLQKKIGSFKELRFAPPSSLKELRAQREKVATRINEYNEAIKNFYEETLKIIGETPLLTLEEAWLAVKPSDEKKQSKQKRVLSHIKLKKTLDNEAQSPLRDFIEDASQFPDQAIPLLESLEEMKKTQYNEEIDVIRKYAFYEQALDSLDTLSAAFKIQDAFSEDEQRENITKLATEKMNFPKISEILKNLTQQKTISLMKLKDAQLQKITILNAFKELIDTISGALSVLQDRNVQFDGKEEIEFFLQKLQLLPEIRSEEPKT